jgi:hypothetical protein
MNRLAQDSNVAAEKTKATAHFQECRTGIRKAPKKSGRRKKGVRKTQERRAELTVVSAGRASPLRIKTFPLGQSREISQ